jgi:hypothetical protein
LPSVIADGTFAPTIVLEDAAMPPVGSIDAAHATTASTNGTGATR